MQTLSGRRASQHPDELRAFIALLLAEGVRSYLEIGARHGDTFYEVMRALPAGSRGVAVDLPGGAWGITSSRNALANAVRKLRREGYEVRMLLGDSTKPEIRRVLEGLRFDAVLIDGDHRYEGVRADWQFCRGLAPLVAFHDIAGEGQVQPTSKLPVEVPRLWAEIWPSCRRSWEFVAPGSRMGIGVVWP